MTAMRVLLVNSYFLENDPNERRIMKPYPPLGLLYLAAALKQAGHAVTVFDGTFRMPGDFGGCLEASSPELVGVYANVITRDAALELGRETCARGIPLVYGGPDPSGDCEAYLAAGAVAVVQGEGERTLLDLMSSLQAHPDGSGLGSIAGLALRNGDGTVHTAERPRIDDVDSLPLPARGAIDMSPYLSAWRERHGHTSMNLITTRGCPYQCAWCSKNVFGSVARQRSPASVVAEMVELRRDYAPDQLWFADDILTLRKEWVLEFARRVAEEGVQTPFECLARVDRVDEEMLLALREAGCFRMWYGAESGSDRVLANMRKGFAASQIPQAVHGAKALGIEVGLFILLGYPGERLKDLLQTLGMVRRLAPHYCGGSVAFPIKGTPFYADVHHLLAPDYAWSRRNENRMSFRGRYPPRFYWFAIRLLNNWAGLWSARREGRGFVKQLVRAVKCAVAGMCAIAIGLAYDLRSGPSAGGTAP